MPNLYVELRQSVLGVRVPEDTQMKGFGVKIGSNLDMGVPDVAQSDIGALRHRYGTPSPLRGVGSGSAKLACPYLGGSS